MQRRRAISWLAGGVIVLAACGSPSTTEPAAQPAATSAEASADESAPPVETATTDATTAATDTAATDTAATNTAATDEPATVSTDVPAPAATDAPATTEAAEAALPDDGCSADNTATDVAAGPLPMLDVRSASADNPLPDVAVRRVNCAGGWVNFKNELPSDKPLLVWFWAPH